MIKVLVIRKNRRLFCFVLSLILFLSMSYPASSHQVETLNIDGIAWSVANDFLSNESTPNGAIASFTLSFNLPDFSAAKDDKFKNVPPEDDLPLASITVQRDETSPTGEPLLTSLISTAKAISCSYDSISTFDGGTRYINYALSGQLGPCINTGQKFDLYEIPRGDENWVAVCRFRSDASPLPCTVSERISKEIVVTYSFPSEYLAEGPEITDHLKSYLHGVQLSSSNKTNKIAPLPLKTVTCWHPDQNSPDAALLPMKFGPEVWHIPQAINKTFGLAQAYSSIDQAFTIWLKLPDLEPLSNSDPSPFSSDGSGKYIDIFFNYDGRPGTVPDRTKVLFWQLNEAKYIGINPFLKDEEYVEGAGNPKFAKLFDYRFRDEMTYISNDPNAGGGSFPPVWFECYEPMSRPTPACTFPLNEFVQTEKVGANVPGVYHIEYFIPWADFSQIYQISTCVQNLYEVFRYGKSY